MKRHDDYLATSPQGEKKVKRAQTFVFCALGVFLFIRLFYFTKNNLRLDYILLLDHDLPLLPLSPLQVFNNTPESTKTPTKRARMAIPIFEGPFYYYKARNRRNAQNGKGREMKGLETRWDASRTCGMFFFPANLFLFTANDFFLLLTVFLLRGWPTTTTTFDDRLLPPSLYPHHYTNTPNHPRAVKTHERSVNDGLASFGS